MGGSFSRHAGAVSAVALLLAGNAAAQETTLLPEVVIGAGLQESDAERVGSAVTVITSEQIAQQGAQNAADALRSLPGVSVSQSGSTGSLTQVRLRGAEANHTLVLIDGIEVNRPGDGEFDFGGLLAGDIERIEIIRGAQSGIYGSNAHAGVINIVTRSGKDGNQALAAFEAGSFGSAGGQIAAGGQSGRFHGRLSIAGLTRDGHNIARTGGERDGVENLTVTAKGGIDITDDISIVANLRAVDRSTDFDSQPIDFVVDSNDFTEHTEIHGRVVAKAELMDGRWSHEAGIIYSDIVTDTFDPVVQTGGTEEDRFDAFYKTTIRHDTPDFLGASHALTAYFRYREETFRNTQPSANASQRALKEREMFSFAAEYVVDIMDRLTISSAIRHDDNDAFDDATTFRITGSYRLDEHNARIHASVGTAVTNPTFFEQFGFNPTTFVGNPNLKPESSTGWDIGIEKTFADGLLVMDVTYFESVLEDEITNDFSGFPTVTVFNAAGESRRSGVEVSALWQPLDWFDLSATYTYLDSTDANGVRENRRPRHAGRIDASARFHDDKGRLTISGILNAEMRDTDFSTFQRITLDDYFLLNASMSYRVSEKTEFFARVENLLDEQYEEIWSYTAQGIGAYAGLKVTLGD